MKDLRSHTSIFISRCLEETKLSTVLVGPLTKVRVNIDRLILKGFSGILIIGSSFASAVLSDGKKLKINIFVLVFNQHVAEASPVTILDTHSVDI